MCSGVLNSEIVLQVAKVKFVNCNHHRIWMTEWTEGDAPTKIFQNMINYVKLLCILIEYCVECAVCMLRPMFHAADNTNRKKEREEEKKVIRNCETWRLLEMHYYCTMHNAQCSMHKVNDMKYKTWIMNMNMNI